jgi:hypothetical protein
MVAKKKKAKPKAKPKGSANARISRVHGSWRVRVLGYTPKFFADSEFGGKQKALEAARAWRDKKWDGKDHNRKLTAKDRDNIRRSKAHYADIAEQYGISANYVHQIRRGDA